MTPSGQSSPGEPTTRELRIDPEHPAFPGHFPGFPVLPGAVLLDHALAAVAQAHGLDLTEWQVAAKFLDPVRPGDLLILEFWALRGQFRFAVRRAHVCVVSGTLSAAGERGTFHGH
jgi:3-hydroxymyristoyl/3-hydroxydecanoyl-(acyl carrier protein) dehydratase